MEKNSELRMVFVTTPNYESAIHISKILVNEKLAACCSISQNLYSIFGWKEHIQERHENLLIIKTIESKLGILESRIRELHSDEVPEILAFPIDSGSKDYIDWVVQSLSE